MRIARIEARTRPAVSHVRDEVSIPTRSGSLDARHARRAGFCSTTGASAGRLSAVDFRGDVPRIARLGANSALTGATVILTRSTV
jgi:hypothetical protein